MLDEAQAAARRQPALVLAGGLAIGLALGRVLRTASSATGNRRYGMTDTDRYWTSGSGRYGGDAMTRGSSNMGSGTAGSDWTGRQPTTGQRYGSTPSAATIGTDPNASVIASTSVVEVGSDIESGRTRGSTGG